MTGQQTQIGRFAAYSKREGLRGYVGVVVDDAPAHRQLYWTTPRFHGAGAKDRAFQAARLKAAELADAPTAE